MSCIYIYIYTHTHTYESRTCSLSDRANPEPGGGPGTDTSEIIVDLQWQFPMDSQRHFTKDCHFSSGFIHDGNHETVLLTLASSA